MHEAVALYRTLATRHPEAFQHYLAGSLHSLAHILTALGQHDGARAALQEVADLAAR